eukprot:4591197-Pyramimonas_sp.AAC.1
MEDTDGDVSRARDGRRSRLPDFCRERERPFEHFERSPAAFARTRGSTVRCPYSKITPVYI